ncbi:ZZ-type zinc finger-containing protein 3 [Araneus ventricosus]|uniref:ZZ-type zinc finger-containing protein 3 n=1 Tax=Araneus ventricosus TaxID=182803 RepID=A0A4Y2GQ19_ARAVE|nr:ZZ-type zinc finger-containing protein 3 [Araneus ventricosus]
MWRVPPSHDWYKRSSPGGSIGLACDRADQTALSRFVSSHLRSCSFSHGNKVFPVCTKCGVASASPEIENLDRRRQERISCLCLSRETFEMDPLFALDFLRDDEDFDPELRETPEYKELVLLRKIQREKLQSCGLAQHIGFKCSNCKTEPIIGIRWHCMDCKPPASVDFCENCADVHSRDNVVPTTMPVIKQRDTNEDCAKTLASTENKLAEDANTSFIEEKSVKGKSPPKQGVKRVNGDLLPTKATQIKKQKKTTYLTIKDDEDFDPELRETPEYKELVLLRKIQREKLQSCGLAQHIGFKCSNCKTEPIIGIRWHCMDCKPPASIDFCENCADGMYEIGQHTSDHRLEEIHNVSSNFHDRGYLHFLSSNFFEPPAT